MSIVKTSSLRTRTQLRIFTHQSLGNLQEQYIAWEVNKASDTTTTFSTSVLSIIYDPMSGEWVLSALATYVERSDDMLSGQVPEIINP